MSYLEDIKGQFPIRRKDEEKQAFLKWAEDEASRLGYQAKVETLGRGGQHRNLVVGDPETAEVVFTAHYDTPAVSLFPNIMMPRNIPLFMLYQFAIVGVLLIVSLAAMLGAFRLTNHSGASMLVFLLVYYALLFAMIKGPSNKNNANDNTSGVAAVLSLMAALPEDARGKAAFILFDNEEKGKLGSKAYAKAHAAVAKDTLLINMDCVGLGEHMLVVAKPLAQALPSYAVLQENMKSEQGVQTHFFKSATSVVNSDQTAYRAGVVICACRRMRVVGFYTPYLHTRRDTVANEGNIAYLAKSLSDFVVNM